MLGEPESGGNEKAPPPCICHSVHFAGDFRAREARLAEMIYRIIKTDMFGGTV